MTKPVRSTRSRLSKVIRQTRTKVFMRVHLKRLSKSVSKRERISPTHYSEPTLGKEPLLREQNNGCS